MTAALFGHLLDALVDPAYAEQDMLLDKLFNGSLGHQSQVKSDHLRGFRKAVTYALDWSSDKLVVATKESGLKLMDVASGYEERSWSGEWMGIQVDPNNPNLAAGISWKGTLKIFDLRSDSNEGVFSADLKQINPAMKEFLVLCWSPDSKYISLATRADDIYMFGIRSDGREQLRLGGSRHSPYEVNQMVYSADGTSLWVSQGGTPGTILVLPTPSFSEEGSTHLVSHQHTVVSLAADPSGQYVASGGTDCLVSLWDPRHHVCVRTFGYPTQTITNMDFNYDGSLLAWGSGPWGSGGGYGGDKILTIAGSHTGRFYLQEPTGAPVAQTRWHPKRNVLAYALVAGAVPEEIGKSRQANVSKDFAVIHFLQVPDKP